MKFAKDDYVKIADINGDYRYGYIEKVTDKGFILTVSLYEEGTSALEYESASGAMAMDWDKMLSDTEREIINSLAAGLSTKDIADQLSLSPVTVRSHIRTLRLKLQLDNRQQLITFSEGMNKRLRKEE